VPLLSFRVGRSRPAHSGADRAVLNSSALVASFAARWLIAKPIFQPYHQPIEAGPRKCRFDQHHNRAARKLASTGPCNRVGRVKTRFSLKPCQGQRPKSAALRSIACTGSAGRNVGKTAPRRWQQTYRSNPIVRRWSCNRSHQFVMPAVSGRIVRNRLWLWEPGRNVTLQADSRHQRS